MHLTPLKSICTALFLLSANLTLAYSPSELSRAQAWSDNNANQIHFTENLGQITQADGQPAPYVAYILQRGNANIYLLRDGGIAYQFNRMHYPDGYHEMMADRLGRHENMEKMQEMQKDIRLETFRMDMHLLNANQHAEIVTEGKSHDYTNYYTHDALFVHHYKKAIYKNIYPGIDWVIYTTPNGGMKYDFVVHPGADPSVIKMQFTHHKELYIDSNGNLIHGNRMGNFTENAPVSFQNGNSINTRFMLNDNILSFEIDVYNPELPLTIDPARIWGTYYGDNQEDFGWGCATDNSGNVYLAGVTTSTINIAVGGHQVIHAGGSDAFLVKFGSNGVRLWSTYYGGNNGDGGTSCTTDISGNVYLAGETSSGTNIAIGLHQDDFGGVYDGFLVKFNNNGIRQWATYYGGSDGDGAKSCATDSNGNVYLAGYTSSFDNIAMNGHQMYIGGNIYDSFLVKFNSIGVRQWGTYYGGPEMDLGYSCITSGSMVYLAGITESITNIAMNGHQNTFGGSHDAFLVKFNDNGIRQWATYYGGMGIDVAYSSATDSSGCVLLAGATFSTNNIALGGGYQDTLGGGIDAFLTKFNSNGVCQWSTYYGGSNKDEAYFCATDGSGNIYLAGTTESTNNIAMGGHQNAYGGGTWDAFLAKFNSGGLRQWATYYGGSNADVAWSCTADSNGSVYLAGYTESAAAIAVGGHQNTFGGGSRDAYLVKFSGTTTSVSESPETDPLPVLVFPNPTAGSITIELKSDGMLEFFSVEGKLLSREELHYGSHQKNIKNFSSGIYLFRFIHKNGTAVQRLVVK